MRCLFHALICSFFVLTSSARAGSIVIDDLTQGPMSYSATGASATNGANQSGINALGGSRGSELEHLFDGGTSTLSLPSGGPLTINGSNNFLDLGYGYAYTAANGIQVSSPMHANLSGTDGIEIDFAPGSSSAGVQLFMTSNENNQIRQSDDNGHGVAKTSAANSIFIPYSSLSPTFNGGVDLAQVDYILISFQNQGSLTITNIAATPEPMLLTPLAMFALALRRRRRS